MCVCVCVCVRVFVNTTLYRVRRTMQHKRWLYSVKLLEYRERKPKSAMCHTEERTKVYPTDQ